MNCLVCGVELKTVVCHGKKGRKGIMLCCPNDGRHLRAFINEPKVVEAVSELNVPLDKAIKIFLNHKK
jgi:transcription elongation factor Elf1